MLKKQNLQIKTTEAQIVAFVHQQIENENLFRQQDETIRDQFDEIERFEKEVVEHNELRDREEAQIHLNKKVP